ncbi:MAG: hypothetical protein M5U29_04640 [Anaerolineae bacterium]|nr:hypothetical protein [Anaerolineae bacterium]
MTCTAEGAIFGINASRIGQIVPGSWQVRQVAAEGGRLLATDGQGRLYCGRGTRVFRLTLGD